MTTEELIVVTDVVLSATKLSQQQASGAIQSQTSAVCVLSVLM